MSSSTSTEVTTSTITAAASISVFNRGPIISIFTPPTSCLSTLTFGTDLYFGHRYTGYFDPSCFPSSTTDRGVSGWDLYYYSPAQCPSGWSQATTLVAALTKGTTAVYIAPDTTAAVCCPSGFNYDGDGHSCRSSFTSKTSTVTYIFPTLNGDNEWVVPSTLRTTTVTDATWNIYGDGIPIMWQSSDIAKFAAAATTSGKATSPTVNNPAVVTVTASPIPIPSNTGLSAGAKIGLGLGIPILLIALAIAGFFIFRRRQGRTRIAQSELGDSNPLNPDPYKAGIEMGNQNRISELYAGEQPYDPYMPRRHELPGR